MSSPRRRCRHQLPPAAAATSRGRRAAAGAAPQEAAPARPLPPLGSCTLRRGGAGGGMSPVPVGAEPRTSALLPLLLLLPPLLLLGRAAGLEVQRKFLSPTPTNNFALDGPGSRVYLAAVNRLFQLSGGELALEAEAAVGPVLDSPLCHAPQLPQASCEHPKVLTNNYNKILQPDPEQGVLVVCGSIYQGLCQLRSMANISAVAVRFPPGGSDPVTVFPSMLNVAANHPNASTVGLVLRRGGGGARLLVAATYTGFGSPFFPRNRSLEDHRFENTPEIAIRALNARGDLAKLFTFDINPSDDNIFKIKQGAKARHKLSFVRAFLQRGAAPPARRPYAYLALNSEANAGDKESPSHSLLARICLGEPAEATLNGSGETKKLTESYIQLGLRCGGPADAFTRLVSVFPARAAWRGPTAPAPAPPPPEELLFGVFERAGTSGGGGRPQSALCVFRFAEIEETIRAARNSCFVSPAAGMVTVLDSVVQGTGPACEKRNIQVRPRGGHLPGTGRQSADGASRDGAVRGSRGEATRRGVAERAGESRDGRGEPVAGGQQRPGPSHRCRRLPRAGAHRSPLSALQSLPSTSSALPQPRAGPVRGCRVAPAHAVKPSCDGLVPNSECVLREARTRGHLPFCRGTQLPPCPDSAVTRSDPAPRGCPVSIAGRAGYFPGPVLSSGRKPCQGT